MTIKLDGKRVAAEVKANLAAMPVTDDAGECSYRCIFEYAVDGPPSDCH